MYGFKHEATGSTPDECVSNFRKAMLQRHNELRVKHGIPLMTESTSMNTVAQNYAETMASTGVFQHSGTSGVGENIAYIMKSSLTPTASTCFRTYSNTSFLFIFKPFTDRNFFRPKKFFTFIF